MTPIPIIYTCKRLAAGLCLWWVAAVCALAQTQLVHSPNIRTLQVLVDNNPLLPPMMDMAKRQHIHISWDEMSHEYHRYIYHLEHCQHDWTPSDGIFESDYLNGLNDQPVEDYEKSFNTTQAYTHYSLRLPNAETSMRISGNYRLVVYEDGQSPDEPVLEARFCVYENKVSIRMAVSSDTDVDFNKSHQQMDLTIQYGALNVTDPVEKLRPVVMQNRRWDTRVTDIKPNIRRTDAIEYTHCKPLIFNAGSEFHKFELIDVHRPAMGVDRIEWFEPYYHATLEPLSVARSYRYDEDQNGIRVIRSEDEDADVTAEYVLTHFLLQSPRLPGGDVYVYGQWTNGTPDPEARMEYDEAAGHYEAVMLLKQGYYSYQFVQEDGTASRTMGDFYETENEYATLVYYRAPGDRTDRLVGYARVNTGGRK